MPDDVDDRIRQFQLRRNGELLLRLEPPTDGALEPTTSGAWTRIGGGWFDRTPQPPGNSETFTVGFPELAPPLLDTLLRAAEGYTLIGWVFGHHDVMGDGRGAVRGPAGSVAAYVVQLITRGFENLFVLGPDDSGFLIVDQEVEEAPGFATVDRYRLPG